MMKYNSYKDSGIDWLGDIPSSWQVMRVKDIKKKIGSGVTPKGGSEVYVDSGIPLLRSQNVYDDGLRIDDVSFIDEETHNKMKNSQLKPYDILINITGASIGRTCIVPDSLHRANINQHIIYIRMKKSLVPYTSYYFKTNSLKEYINLIQAGSSKEALNMGQTLSTPILIPSIQEQHAIASYLQTKTQAIDKKVSLLQKKITYYQELRKSLIKNTVTKGLNKDVKLKDSGIDWIGKIPEHWEVKRLKDVFSFSKGKNSTKYNQVFINDKANYGQYPVYSGQTENGGIMATINSYDYDDQSPSLLVTTVGAKAMSVRKIVGKYSLSQNCALIKIVNTKNNVGFFYYYLIELFREERKIIPTIMQPSLRIEDLVKYPLLIPKKDEQQEIATYLDINNSKIDEIIKNIHAQITAFKELRKTLINDVVTGKIKVTQD